MIHATRRSRSLLNKRLYHASSSLSARVLLTDGVDDCCVKIFEERGHQVDFMKTMSETELNKIIGVYEGIVVRSATKVNANVLQHAVKMRVVGRAGVGVDNIDIIEATKRGVMVMNTPGGNTVSTAQLAVSLLASLARMVPAADMSVKEGKWDRCVHENQYVDIYLASGHMRISASLYLPFNEESDLNPTFAIL
jgi:D-3-phosphoglycerate dehydrogenase / 2-oxoglutarate reductase